MKKRLTLADYAIIIFVICAIALVLFHIFTDDGNSINESTSYDSSTLNKIVEKYLNYYRQGLIVRTTVHGYNSTTREPITLKGSIVWMDDNKGNDVKGLVNSDGKNYIVGLYNHVPDADVYIDTITLEVDGDKYPNLTEIKANPKNITSVNDLISDISNDTDYEITAILSLDTLDTITVQKMNNALFKNDGRISVKTTNVINQISIVRGTSQELSQVDSILGDFAGITNKITIRIYNCSDSDIEYINNNFDIIDIEKF